VIHTTDPDETGIDIYLGIGGAPKVFSPRRR
jgi:fructose-1,6-bisphosphatase II / sedoheptulose-1,7-bisphosphatase